MVEILFNLLGQPEVSELDVAVEVHEDVFRLQVTVQNIQRVQMLQRHDDLADINPRLVLSESPLRLLLDDLLKVAAGAVLQH